MSAAGEIVLSPELRRVHAELAREQVDDAVHREDGLGSPGAAVGRVRRLVGHDAMALHLEVGHAMRDRAGGRRYCTGARCPTSCTRRSRPRCGRARRASCRRAARRSRCRAPGRAHGPTPSCARAGPPSTSPAAASPSPPRGSAGPPDSRWPWSRSRRPRRARRPGSCGRAARARPRAPPGRSGRPACVPRRQALSRGSHCATTPRVSIGMPT